MKIPFIVIFMVFGLSACGGGGGLSTEPPVAAVDDGAANSEKTMECGGEEVAASVGCRECSGSVSVPASGSCPVVEIPAPPPSVSQTKECPGIDDPNKPVFGLGKNYHIPAGELCDYYLTLDNIGGRYGTVAYLPLVGADYAYNREYFGQGITGAVVDTGVKIDHEDLNAVPGTTDKRDRYRRARH